MLRKTLATLVATLFVGMAWGQIDLNQATEIDLDGLNGLGPTMTRHILAERQQGPFRDWREVMKRVKGIGPQKAAHLSEQGLQVQGLGYAQSPGASPTAKPKHGSTPQRN